MRAKTDLEEFDQAVLDDFYEQSVKDMLSSPNLTDEEKQELLRQLSLPDDEWEPIELPPGAEPMSETIIRMRRESVK